MQVVKDQLLTPVQLMSIIETPVLHYNIEPYVYRVTQ